MFILLTQHAEALVSCSCLEFQPPQYTKVPSPIPRLPTRPMLNHRKVLKQRDLLLRKLLETRIPSIPNLTTCRIQSRRPPTPMPRVVSFGPREVLASSFRDKGAPGDVQRLRVVYPVCAVWEKLVRKAAHLTD